MVYAISQNGFRDIMSEHNNLRLVNFGFYGSSFFA